METSTDPRLARAEALIDLRISVGEVQKAHIAELDSTFGQRVREERELLRMPQQYMATLMTLMYGHKWHQTTVAKVELGERPVKLSEAVAVSYILGVPLAHLISQRGDKESARSVSMQLALVELARLEQYIAQRKGELTKTEP